MMLHCGNVRQFLFEMFTIMLANNCADGRGNRARLVHVRKCSTIAKYAKRFPGANVRRRLPDASAAVAARRRVAHWSFACLMALFAALALLPQYGMADQGAGGATLERRVKAAFLYKFLGYTEFPSGAFADQASPVTIAVAGSDEMAAELSAITAGRAVNNHPITVHALREGESGPVHLLFVAGADCARAGRVIHSVRALLVVTECDSGLQQGSVINFRIVDEHVRFDVSLDAAEKNNVKLSSRLLTVANHVQRGPQ